MVSVCGFGSVAARKPCTVGLTSPTFVMHHYNCTLVISADLMSAFFTRPKQTHVGKQRLQRADFDRTCSVCRAISEKALFDDENSLSTATRKINSATGILLFSSLLSSCCTVSSSEASSCYCIDVVSLLAFKTCQYPSCAINSQKPTADVF